MPNIENLMSHPVRGAWIEIFVYAQNEIFPKSHPVRGAWIEILSFRKTLGAKQVAPRQGCVD